MLQHVEPFLRFVPTVAAMCWLLPFLYSDCLMSFCRWALQLSEICCWFYPVRMHLRSEWQQMLKYSPIFSGLDAPLITGVGLEEIQVAAGEGGNCPSLCSEPKLAQPAHRIQPIQLWLHCLYKWQKTHISADCWQAVYYPIENLLVFQTATFNFQICTQNCCLSWMRERSFLTEAASLSLFLNKPLQLQIKTFFLWKIYHCCVAYWIKSGLIKNIFWLYFSSWFGCCWKNNHSLQTEVRRDRYYNSHNW